MKPLVEHRYGVAESALWDERTGEVMWCDIPAGTIHSAPLDGSRLRTWSLPDRVGSFGLCESGRLVVALPNSVILFDRETQAIEHLAHVEADVAYTRLNDGKVGPDGAYWVGSMDERDDKQSVAALYRVTATGQVSRVREGLQVSNGLAWSADGRTMFHTDSRLQFIDAHDFDAATGALGNRRHIASSDEANGRPDGGAGDADGHYWSAGVSAGVLNRWSITGELLAKVPVPVPHPTMPAFCGPELSLCLVTSLKRPDSTNPMAGAVLIGDIGVKGTPVHRMRGV